MRSLGRNGQGESLIKLLVVAIIAIIAIAVAKSYFRETSRSTQKTVDEVFNPSSTGTSSQISEFQASHFQSGESQSSSPLTGVLPT